MHLNKNEDYMHKYTPYNGSLWGGGGCKASSVLQSWVPSQRCRQTHAFSLYTFEADLQNTNSLSFLILHFYHPLYSLDVFAFWYKSSRVLTTSTFLTKPGSSHIDPLHLLIITKYRFRSNLCGNHKTLIYYKALLSIWHRVIIFNFPVQYFSSRGNFAPRKHFAMPADICDYFHGDDVTGIWQVNIRGAVKHPTGLATTKIIWHKCQ